MAVIISVSFRILPGQKIKAIKKSSMPV